MISLLGWLVAALPETVVEGLCRVAGAVLWASSRGAAVRRNMRMALEITDRRKLSALSYEACCRTIELGLLGLAGQFFSAERWRRMIAIAPEMRTEMLTLSDQPRGVLLFVPHTTLMEALTALPLFVPENKKRVSVLYRAFASAALERTVLARRQQHGVRLLSRDKGVRELARELQKGQVSGILFDQNSGHQGGLISFMGRVAAASDLGDVLYAYARPVPVVLAIKRTGFWRGEVVVKRLDEGKLTGPVRSHSRYPFTVKTPEQPEEEERTAILTLQAHRWLEGHLRDEATTVDWLWVHRRWKTLDTPRVRLGLNHKKVLEVPAQRKTKIFVRIPNWLGDVVMALPVLRALRESRPDAEITYFAKSAYLPLLAKFGLADRVLGIPKGTLAAWRFFAGFREEAPDFTVALTNSLRGDLEMLATGCKQRAGLWREGYWRPLINCGLRVGKKERASTHQSHVWAKLFKALGLKAEVSYEPFKILGGIASLLSPLSSPAPLGAVCGSANTPEKRYPAAQWRAVFEKIAPQKVRLFGSPGERELCAGIAEGLANVENLAGTTDLAGLAEALAGCRAVVGNDTGAMHLANALGVPTVVLYGPTSPTVTRPIFEAPEAPYCELKAGDGVIASIAPETVAEAVRG